MALLYNAELTPSKLDLLRAWAPTQTWWPNAAIVTELAGAYRFDDPDGEVGIETHLLRTDTGAIVQVPLTYRAAPLVGAEDALAGTMQHSVLGPRWIYDGCADPVFVAALAAAIRTGGTQAELQVHSADGVTLREPATRVQGSGYVDVDVELEIDVRRVIADVLPGDTPPVAATLTGTWPERDQPAILAIAHAVS